MKKTTVHSKSLNIIATDDNFIIQEGLKQLLSNEYQTVEIEEADSENKIFKKIKNKKWNMLIIDTKHLSSYGFRILKQLKNKKIDIPVLVLGLQSELHIAKEAFRYGADGYLYKEMSAEELRNAVNKILNHRKYIPDFIAQELVCSLTDPSNKDPHELLSNRECQITLLITAGKTVSQIAKFLSLNISTISTYRTRILDKLNLKTNSDLMLYCNYHKLI